MTDPRFNTTVNFDLNEDLGSGNREFFVKNCISHGPKVFPEGSVFQLTNIQDVTRPKSDQGEESKNPVFKLQLSDGSDYVNAVVAENIIPWRLEIPLGAKLILLSNVPYESSLILLNSKNHKVLGGCVQNLERRRALNAQMNAKRSWEYSMFEFDNDRPKFTPLERNEQFRYDDNAVRNKKTTDVVDKNKKVKEKDEFELQREEIVGGMENLELKSWAFPVKDKQFAAREKQQAEVKEVKKPAKPDLPSMVTKPTRGGGGGRGRGRGDEEDDAPIPKEFQRPSRSISLFGFIEEQLKDTLPASTGEASGHTQGSGPRFPQNDFPSLSEHSQEYSQRNQFSGPNSTSSSHNSYAYEYKQDTYPDYRQRYSSGGRGRGRGEGNSYGRSNNSGNDNYFRQDSFGGHRQDSYGGHRQDSHVGNRQDSYVGNRQDSYGGNRQDSYGGNRQDSYGGNRQDSYGGNGQDSYGSCNQSETRYDRQTSESDRGGYSSNRGYSRGGGRGGRRSSRGRGSYDHGVRGRGGGYCKRMSFNYEVTT